MLSTTSILLLASYYPYLQDRFSGLQAAPLAGAFTVSERPKLSISNWLRGDFQADYTRAIKENPDIRPFFVRLKNEALLQLFGTESHPVLQIGKDGYLFDKTYIYASLGLDYKGDAYIAEQAKRLQELHHYLQEKNKTLLMLMPPSKAAHIPEKLPRAYRSFKPKTTNRQALAQALKQQGVPYIDFSYLRERELSSGLRMYPATGLHWSHYGATLAADSLAHRIEKLLNIQLPDLQIDSLLLTNELRSPDNEFGELLNLYTPYVYDTMAYPILSYDTDSNTYKPKVLIVGDSYYRLMYDMKFQEHLFDPASQYWHYFEKYIAPNHTSGVAVDKNKGHLQELIEQMDVVLYVVSATNVHRIGFGFTEAVLGSGN